VDSTVSERPMPMIEQRGSAVRVRVRVQPRASRTVLAGEMDGMVRIRLAAPPVDNAANEELVRFIARTLRTAPSRVRIVSGDGSRSKLLEIEDADADVVRAALLGR
jgi:uncharacterized protein (TIGR00251 family)